MTSKLEWRRSRLLAGIAFGAFLAYGATTPALAILTQDNIDPASLLDSANVYKNVGALLIVNPDSGTGAFVCTGTLINPRTVLTATHCVQNSPGGTEIYTSSGPSFVVFRLNPNGNTDAGQVFATDVIAPSGAGTSDLFPDLDFTIVALGTPVGDIEYAPVLLSPLTKDTLATMVGYGTFGQGSEPDQGFDLRRRVAQNVIQYLGTFEDFDDDTFGPDDYGDSSQMLYWADFDRVGREDFFDDPTGIDYDPLPGDALNDPGNPQKTEGNTGPGDSGGPLFAHVKGKQYLAGVLSGGFTISGDGDGNGLFGYFGTETYWNPVYKYADFLIANNPYKYVHALHGNGDWTDPGHWEQTLDPAYFVADGNGQPRNAIPTHTPTDAQAHFGTFRNIFDVLDGGDGLPHAAAHNDVGMVPTSTLAAATSGDSNRSGAPTSGGPNRPASLAGPGSRNFVPNNTNGTPGTEFVNPAQYFDVTLDENGTTTLKNASITIDHFSLADSHATLNIKSTGALRVNLEAEIQTGDLNVDGTLTARRLINTLGVLEGNGSVTTTNGVSNLAGLVSPGGHDVGTLTINGAFSQSNFGTIYFQIGKNSVDLLKVNGAASIAGLLLVDSDRKLKFGDRFEVVHANSVSGNFDLVFGSGTLLFGRSVADADSIDLLIDAHKLADLFGIGSNWGSLASALDYARGNSFAALTDVFGLLDNMPLESLNSLLPTLTPLSAMGQMPLAISYSQTFTRDLAARTAELRSGQYGISERSLLNGYRMLQGGGEQEAQGSSLTSGGTRPVDMGQRFGMFISGDGNLMDVGREAYEGDRYDPASLAFVSQANMTVGMDYRVADNFVLGIATTMARFQTHDGDRTPLDHTGYGAMLYSSVWEGDAFLDSYFGFAYQDFDVSRQFFNGASLGLANSNPAATQTIAGARAGWMLHPTSAFAVGPTVRLNYSAVSFGAYEENGGGSFDLLVDARDMTSLTVETAMEFSYQPVIANSDIKFAAYGRVGVVSEVGDGVDLVHARFAAAPDVAFDLAQGLDRQWVSAGVGMSFQLGDNTIASLEGNTDIGRGDLSSVSVTAGFTFRF